VEGLLSITPLPVLSGILWLVLLVTTMYLARKPFHRFMRALSRVIFNTIRLAATSVRLAEKRLQMRNREVLMNAGLEAAERSVEREFDRINAGVQRDLEGYPRLQRAVTQELLKIEEDYTRCATIPQSLPDWVKVIDAIANIRPSGDQMVTNMLEEIHHTLTEQHRAAVERHRRDVAERHTILSRMLPFWRGVQKTLQNVEKAIGNLNQHSRKIDRYMDSYEKTLARTDTARRQLALSSLTQFLVSGLVLAVAAVGAIINFNLVALPMSEMVGGSSFIGNFRTSDVAGVFLVSLQIVVGIFLMDALRITRLFSAIGGLEDNKRRAIVWGLLVFLTILAGMESSLAFLRDRITSDMEVLRQTLAGEELAAVGTSSIPTIGQMIMGFTLPFVLAFVAIPSEAFISSSRTALGIVVAWGLRVTAFVLRLFGNLAYYTGRLVVYLYDLAIFPALWLEETIARKANRMKEKEEKSADTAPGAEDTGASLRKRTKRREAGE
jgi:hypothetical protein